MPIVPTERWPVPPKPTAGLVSTENFRVAPTIIQLLLIVDHADIADIPPRSVVIFPRSAVPYPQQIWIPKHRLLPGRGVLSAPVSPGRVGGRRCWW